MVHALRFFSTLLACIVMIMTLLACGTSENNVTTGNRDQILHWGNGDEPQALDPHVVTGVPEHHIIISLLEGLVLKDPSTLEPIPAVAKSWSISENGKEYTFYLREDARWSNGDRLTASDFVWSWHRALLPSLGNLYAYMFYPIKNAEAFHKGKLERFSDVGIKALDPLTLQITLNHPTPYFLQLLDHYSMFPVHRPTIETFGAAGERGTRWTRVGNFVGNGAFSLKQWTLNKVIVVEKNPLYWDAENVKLNGIHYYPMQNLITEERMFRAGQLHRTSSVPVNKIKVYQRDDAQTLKISPYLGTYFYRINTRIKHLQDVRVRRALSMAIDRDQLVKYVTQAGELAAYTVTPPNTMGYTATAPQPTYDPESARALLAEAGYPNGKGLPVMELLFNTSEAHRKIAVAVQQMWKKELNISVSLLNQDWKVYLDSVNSFNYQIARAAWIGDYVDPNSFLDMWIKDGGNNRTGWHDPEYDRLVLEVAPSVSEKERHRVFRKAETLMLNAAPIIPIYTYVSKHLIHSSVKGLEHNLLNYPLFKQISLGDASQASP